MVVSILFFIILQYLMLLKQPDLQFCDHYKDFSKITILIQRSFLLKYFNFVKEL